VSASAARIGFILNPFRRAISETTDAKTKFGSQARQSEDPVETFFDNIGDADVMADERQALLSPVRRRFDVSVSGLDEVMSLTYAQTVPVTQYIDPERLVDRPALIGDIVIDLGKQTAKLNVWG